MRILSLAENYRRVARRMSLITVSAGFRAGPDVCFIFVPQGYDEPAILRSLRPSSCLRIADGEQAVSTASPFMHPPFGSGPVENLPSRTSVLFRRMSEKRSYFRQWAGHADGL